MPTTRRTALLAALLLTLAWGPATLAQDSASADEQSLDHIRLLEQMLRDAGIDPPARPDALNQSTSEGPEPIVPPSFASVVFKTEVAAINERGSKAAGALKHVRRWLDREDVKRRVAAQDVVDAVQGWAEMELLAIELKSDKVQAYILADDAINLLGQDPLAQPFKRFVHSLKEDRAGWRDIESLAAYRRALEQARAIGLTGDWELIDLQNTNVRNAIKAVSSKLSLIASSWPNSQAAQLAQANLDDWSNRESQALNALPAWRYTWQMDLIHIGTEQKTTIVTRPDGTIIISEDQTQLFDPNNIVLYGTFQNTSDKPYRYTFLVGATSNAWPNTPFPKLNNNQLLGFELIQTPLLEPGELYRWETILTVKSIHNLKRAGIGMVEPHEDK